MSGTQLYAGSLADFDTADSMARAIEDALTGFGVNFSGNPKDRRLMFLGIAHGVINHLQAKQDAFQVSVSGSAAGDGTVTASGGVQIQVQP
jgi:hypothetical protein